MKSTWLFGIALVLAGTSAVLAADLTPRPVYKAPPRPVSLPWSGFYAGANVGYGWGRAADTWAVNAINTNINIDPIFGVCAPTGFSICAGGTDTTTLRGVFGGLQGGYNWQFSGLVTGIEADLQLSAQKGSSRRSGITDLTQFGAVPGAITIDQTNKLEWFGTLRGRIGLPFNQFLIYGTGGLAYGSVRADISATANGVRDLATLINCLAPAGCPAIAFANGSDRRVAVGWTLGAGFEAMLSGKWTLKVEYLHIDLGTVKTSVATLAGCYGNGTAVLAACFPVGPGTATSQMRVTDEIVRVGVNYRFGG